MKIFEIIFFVISSYRSLIDEKVVPQYENFPISNQVEGRTFNLIFPKKKPVLYEKRPRKHVKRLPDEPVIEYGFVPIKGEPNLFHKEYYVKVGVEKKLLMKEDHRKVPW